MQSETLTAPVSTKAQAAIPTVRNFIGGKWVASGSGRTVPNLNPANTDEVLCNTPLSSREEAQTAIAAAKSAFQLWKDTPPPVRGKLMFNAMSLLQQRHEEMAVTLTKEEGKILRDSRAEVQRSISILEYAAGEGRRLKGSTIPSEQHNSFVYTIRQPVGVCGIITPWNFPVAVPIWKLAPALVGGNTVVFKPSTYTPLTATKIVEIFEEAGFPPGVVNLVHGGGKTVGHEIVNHPDVRAISFTGSNAAGNAIYTQASTRGIRVQCEMGGKNPLVVLADANLQLAVEGVIQGGFESTGQRCTASSRVIVEKPILETFKKMLLERMKQLRVGDGMLPETDIGPSFDESQLRVVLDYIGIGINERARLLTGGKRMNDPLHAKGYFVEPTLFDNAVSNMRIAQEEIFGPVVCLLAAKDFEEAVELANDVKYGLSASLYSNDISRIIRFAERSEVGKVHINAPPIGGEAQAPFGGTKATGIGPRECGSEAFEFYTETKTVYVNYL